MNIRLKSPWWTHESSTQQWLPAFAFSKATSTCKSPWRTAWVRTSKTQAATVFIQDFSTFLLMKDFNRSFAHICSLFCAVSLTCNIAALEVVSVQCLVKKNKLSLSDCWYVTYYWKENLPECDTGVPEESWPVEQESCETLETAIEIFDSKDSSWLTLLYQCAEGWQSWTATSNVWVCNRLQVGAVEVDRTSSAAPLNQEHRPALRGPHHRNWANRSQFQSYLTTIGTYPSRDKECQLWKASQ